MEELRFRQIHMDFHTSEKIANVGEKFNAEEFAKTLEEARVNSVTCFSRCHHGMLYYNSKAFPELVHPGLKNKNLLSEQIDACHKRGIKVPIYTTVQWDYHMSNIHPEWCCLTADGGIVEACGDTSSHVYKAGFYRTLCVNNPEYKGYLKQQMKDLFATLTLERIDGIFFDIVNVVDCSCKNCVQGMVHMGFNPENREDRIQYAINMLKEFRLEMTEFIHGMKKGISVFYNAGHVGSVAIDSRDAFTHWELESLPSGEWGYSHFTNTVRYARTTGMDYLAQTGKFQTAWGDFHSFKNPQALQYECFRMLAYNSKCLIGDQLHPDGMISKPVYDLIGGVYKEVEKKEPWCRGAKAITEIAVLTDEWQNTLTQTGMRVSNVINGVCALLDELGYQFDIVDNKIDWNGYKLLVLPDTILFNQELVNKVERYIKNGGKILATGKSGLNEEKNEMILKCLGVEYVGEAPYFTDYIMPNEIIGKSLPKTEHVMYLQGEHVTVTTGTVLMDAYIPYFNRSWQHFCSHLHTPSSHEKGYPAVVKNNECIYFIHPIFSIYQKKHPSWCRELIKDAIELLMPEQVIVHNGPSTMAVTLNKQCKEKRYIVHGLHYIPVKKCQDLCIIDDVIPLYEIEFCVKIKEKVRGVKIVPDNKEILFSEDKGNVKFTIPKIEGHVMVELSYE